MAAQFIAVCVGVIAAFGAAYFAAWLQRKWTPDPIPAIKDIETQVKNLHERVDEIEQERAERDSFTLGIQVQQATLNAWIIVVTNDTDKDVDVETIQFFDGDDTPLSEMGKPSRSEDWLIPSHSPKQLWWKPQYDPIMTLKTAGVEPHGLPHQYRLVLTCRSDGKRRTVQRYLLLTYRDNTLTQYGP